MPAYYLSQYAAPTEEPLALSEAKKQVELPTAYTAHDEHLSRLIVAARQHFESETNRQICTATWDLVTDRFPDESCEPISLPKSPVASVASVSYVDTNGATQAWGSSNYVLSKREPATIRTAYGVTWPLTRCQPDAVTIRYVCGYGGQSSVPQELRAGLLLLVSHWFSHRELSVTGTIISEVPRSVQAIIDHYRVGDEFTEYGESLEYADA